MLHEHFYDYLIQLPMDYIIARGAVKMVPALSEAATQDEAGGVL